MGIVFDTSTQIYPFGLDAFGVNQSVCVLYIVINGITYKEQKINTGSN